MGQAWTLVLDLVVALASALVLGLLAERIRINAVIGYLVAGAVIGPGGLKVVEQAGQVSVIAEIGVALLLFTIGLEFSWRRLKKMGGGALVGGLGAILLTLAVVAGASMAFGMAWQTAVVLGAAGALSSTAVVLRVLRTNNDLDTLHGKTALGVLLLQDIAVVPMVLLVTFLSSGSADVWADLGQTAWRTVVLVVGLVFFTSLVVPRLLDEKIVARNRELPIILAVVTCVGATVAAHELGLSPALGAFFAGMLLAESKFSDQMRADVLPLRTLFVTIFFVSVGLLADLGWLVRHFPVVLAVSLGVVGLKSVATYVGLRPFSQAVASVLAAALAISQVGEFSFVLLNIGRDGGLIDPELFQLAISVTLVTLVSTPFLAGNALRIARKTLSVIPLPSSTKHVEKDQSTKRLRGHLLVVGYGEAGQATCEALERFCCPVVVIDVNPRYVSLAESAGFTGMIGDATSHEILEAANIHDAKAVVVTVSDHDIARLTVSQSKSTAPHVRVVVRSRYHVHRDELDVAGADEVVDEETLVGVEMSAVLERLLAAPEGPVVGQSS